MIVHTTYQDTFVLTRNGEHDVAYSYHWHYIAEGWLRHFVRLAKLLAIGLESLYRWKRGRHVLSALCSAEHHVDLLIDHPDNLFAQVEDGATTGRRPRRFTLGGLNR